MLNLLACSNSVYKIYVCVFMCVKNYCERLPYMFIGLYRLILINYMYHPRLYVSPLFRLILINVFAGLFKLILYNVIGIVWHDVILFRFILNYKFVTFWHDIILLQFCKYAYFQK